MYLRCRGGHKHTRTDSVLLYLVVQWSRDVFVNIVIKIYIIIIG